METADSRVFLSLAIPTYNRAGSLKKLLDNILAQINGREKIEICISDNDSKDNTKEVVAGFEKKHPGLINYSKNEKNLGGEKNLFLAMKMANGRFVWTLGDDDLIAENGIKDVILFIKKNCKENTGLVALREKSYFIDENTKQKIIFSSSFDHKKPEILELSRKDIIMGQFQSSAFMSILIFNNIFLKKTLEQENDLAQKAIDGTYPHVFLYRLMFLKFKELEGIIFNKNIILQEISKYKVYIEGRFRHHYIAKNKMNKFLLDSGYADEEISEEILKNKKELRKDVVQDIIMAKTFCSFNYLSFFGVLKMFFKNSPAKDAVMFSFVFVLMFFTPPFVLKQLLKIYFFVKYSREWKHHWVFCETVHFRSANGGSQVL